MSDFPQKDVWLEHRVSYGETDCMSVLYHAEYLHLFERSRNTYIRSCGVSYKLVEERGIFLPVRHADCRYRIPARYDDRIWIRTGISEWKRASMIFVYEIYNEDKNSLHASGSTEHAVVNGQGKPVRIPDWFTEIFQGKSGRLCRT